MSFDPMTMARARLALRKAVSQHLFDPNVRMVSIGLPEKQGQLIENELAIRYHVRQKYETPFQLEAALESGMTNSDLTAPVRVGRFVIQTDIVQGKYRPHLWNWSPWWNPPPANPRAQRADPMRGGMSISDEFHNAYGTLGGKVIDRATGAEMILSNWHVLVADWGARQGQRIYQPGRLDGGKSTDTVATLTRDAMATNLDAAVATLNGPRQLSAEQFNLGPVTGVGMPQLGMKVTKSGRRTDVTRGRITDIDATVRMTYGSIAKLIRNVMSIEPLLSFEQVSGPGDSGSLWIDTATNQAVGLHFAGSDAPERGLAMDLMSVLDALNVNLVVEPTTQSARRRVWTGAQPLARRRAAPAARPVVVSQAEEALVMG
jgi:endonuclease G